MTRLTAHDDTLRLARMVLADEDDVDVNRARHLALLDPQDLDFDLSDQRQRLIGDYELLEKLGQGGMGVVYRARQLSLGREVAIKFLAAGPWASQDFIERFRREARSAARMQHPNIVEIYEIGQHETLNWFSMRLVRGRSLAEHLELSGPLPVDQAAGLVRTLAEAVDYAHRLGVLHLDLKPGNVLINDNGEPLIADFGLARNIDDGTTVACDDISGTPNYMAPEQVERRASRLSPATDLWGIGTILYEALCGRPPFSGPSAQATMASVVSDQPVSPQRYRKEVPPDLEAICMHCLDKKPEQRFRSARDVADDLGRFLDGHMVSVRRAGPIERLRRFVAHEPRVAGLIALVMVSLGIGFAMTAVQWQRAETALVETQAARIAAEDSSMQMQRTARMMAAMLHAHGSESVRDAQIDELIDWLERELPGDDPAQGAHMQAFTKALIAEGRSGTVGQLLASIHERFGRAFTSRALAGLDDRTDPEGLSYRLVLAHSLDLADDDARSQALDLLRQAVARHASDPDIAMLATHYCSLHPEEPCPDHYQRIAGLVPNNAISWVFRMAEPDQDEDQQRRFLREAARAEHLDDYWGTIVKKTAAAFAASGEPMPAVLSGTFSAARIQDEPELAAGLISTWSLPLPPFSHLRRLCHPDQIGPADQSRHADCVAVGHLLADSRGGLVANAVGWTMLRRLLPDTDIAREMTERRRMYEWTASQYTELMTAGHDPMPETFARDLIEHGEFEAMARRIEQYGIARQPPRDWER
jgi:hypothetical protein